RTGTKIVKNGTEYCTECRKEGHRHEGCFKIIGYPDWWPRKKGDKSRGKAAYVETEISPIPGFLRHFSRTGNTESIKPTANMAQKESEQGEWIFDSGCTEYITHLSNALTNNKDTPFENPVIIPNGDSIPVKGKGECILPGGKKINGGLQKRNLIGIERCQGGLYKMKMTREKRAMATTIETWHKRL
nr:hypothetical protein [Tanacetum cinerariifolium]